MKRTWTYNALALIAVVLIASSATVASAEETGARVLPKIPSAKAYLDNLGNNNQKTDPRAGYTDPVRPGHQPDRPILVGGHGSTTVGVPPRPMPPRASTTPIRDRMDDRAGSSTRPVVRPGIASTTRPGNMSTTTRERNEQRIKEEMKRLAERLLAVIHRLEEIIVRIESRATKIDQAGGNTTDARTDIAIAKTEIAAAKQDLSTIQAAAVSILNASNMAAVSASLAPIRTTTDSAQMHIKKAREAIESAVKKLGVAARAIRQNATTTPRI
ncbi:MAG: hypothetical protein KBC74_02590 [Candidatus Pacebacteria bacterium]|nr:hypothetical protein [Candidatus Paceibacterota bacterium]MBP9832385.1 hypothetical protein [Candidatus Paceibacterota bacterium]